MGSDETTSPDVARSPKAAEPALRLVVCSDAFVPAEQEGGLPFAALGLCRAFREEGVDVRVVTTDRNGSDRLAVPVDRWSDRDGLPVWYARSLPGPYYPALSFSRALAAAGEVDCVLGSGTLWTHLGLVLWRTARKRGIPFLLYPQGLLDPWALAFKAVRKRLYWALVARRIVRAAHAVVAVSEAERRAVEAFGAARRIEVIPNGVRLQDFAAPPPREELDTWLPGLAGRGFVLFLGRVHEKKGADVLIEALSRPALSDIGLVAVIAGPVDEGYRARYEGLVAESPARNRIVLAGPVTGSRKAGLLAHATAFVLPSQSEGLPVAALEALASGCPTVLSPACNLPEAVAAGAGLEVAPDPDLLARELGSLLGRAELRRSMSEKARALVGDRFDGRRVGALTVALCRDVSNRR